MYGAFRWPFLVASLFVSNGCRLPLAGKGEVDYPSDTSRAYAELDRLLASDKAGRSIRANDLDSMVVAAWPLRRQNCDPAPCHGVDSVRAVDSMKAELTRIARRPMTPHEPLAYGMLINARDMSVKRGLQLIGRGIPAGLATGIVAAPCMNAATEVFAPQGAASDTAWLVWMNIGTDVTLGEVAKIASLAIDITSTREGVAIAYSSVKGRSMELDSLIDDFLIGQLSAAPAARPQSIVIDSLRQTLAAVTLAGMEEFLLGHEYGHVLLHHGLASTRTVPISGRRLGAFTGSTADVAVFSRQREAAADSFATEVLAAKIKAEYPSELWPLVTAGPELLFAWETLVEQSLAFVSGNPHPEAGYPTSSERRAAFRANVHRLGIQPPANADFAGVYADAVAGFSESLQNRLERNKAELQAKMRSGAAKQCYGYLFDQGR